QYSIKDTSNVDSVRVPVIMYHQVLKSKLGQYIVTDKQLEEDLIAFKNAGYEPVFSDDVANFVKRGGTLPKKPIILTFDDGHYNFLSYAFPLLEKYGMKAEVNVIGCFTEFSTSSGDHSNPAYSYLTWEQIKLIADSGIIKVGTHTYAMHSYKPRFGISRKYGESDEQYFKALKDDIEKLNGILLDRCGVKVTSFAFPFGKYNDEATDILKQYGIEVMYTCNEGISIVKRGEEKTLSRLRRINRDGRISTKELLDRIEYYYN
ncbi:MAG: polysaccharide deacetylase family protein, partial [Clostridiales bacterium]|nr:polysaccharide deacetylase family protein [Clostridiales bacterium]